MLLSEVEANITAVLKSLNDTPRNAYEVSNLYRLNCERIALARATLADMSGDYVDQLKGRCNEAEKQIQAKHTAGVAGPAAIDNAFSLDFEMEEAEKANAVELEIARTAAGGSKCSSKKSGAKSKSKKSKGGEKSQQPKEERKPASSPPPLSPNPQDSVNDSAVKTASTVQPELAVLDRQEDLASSDLPVALTTSGRGRCEPVSNSPFARLFFTENMNCDGVACHCAVELYRCIVVALTYGDPQLSWVECQKVLQAQLAAGLSTGKGTVSKGGPLMDAPAPAFTSTTDSQGGAAEESVNIEEEDLLGEDLTLSEQLIVEYEQAQLAEAEQDLDTSSLPRDVTEKLQQRLRTFTDDVWVVLLCHGGYFAGGVFVRGTCVVHKAFQRYVVRKKQGGKQSSNAKDGGSYNSVGSQIRAAQEVKWRVDVRDILLEWAPYIQAAAFILYAAPGPQNRAVLTDFSLLPAVAGVGGGKSVSPIHLKDRRVSRVPVTTHRPTFEEVQRIYTVCSRCTLLYVRDEEDD
ncbi:hypothetical protein ABL78_7939 [Leptomonas seymouri]|uniref:VLRF1 domain-containing protein n=1 Tax=Leptomonas seymouri TaxID=5684 RepID=A0A0N1IGL8_LEPSE|nr:hypothetical protein ABL78_7939 [Leptomonas seymouri]|eukprot:KPI83040.1 hypothetical protein ABL78_7939 [Leptomonas seymouri]